MAEEIDYKKQVENAQMVRLWDVFFIAPVLVFTGIKYKLPILIKIALIGIGAGTFLYNGYFFLKYKNGR